jgi:hypothetical protein
MDDGQKIVFNKKVSRKKLLHTLNQSYHGSLLYLTPLGTGYSEIDIDRYDTHSKVNLNFVNNRLLISGLYRHLKY